MTHAAEIDRLRAQVRDLQRSLDDANRRGARVEQSYSAVLAELRASGWRDGEDLHEWFATHRAAVERLRRHDESIRECARRRHELMAPGTEV